MTPNIIYLDNAFYVTELTEWPQRPDSEPFRKTDDLDSWLKLDIEYHQITLKEARTHLTPIVEEDWEKMKTRILTDSREPLDYKIDKIHKMPYFEFVNGTIYKDTGCEFEEVEQWRRKKDHPQFDEVPEWIEFNGNLKFKFNEYRKAFRLNENLNQ